MDADAHGAGLEQVGDRLQVAGRLALDLDRQPRHGLHDGADAPGQVGGAAVPAGRGARGHDHLPHAVEADGGLSDLGQLGRGLHRHGGAGRQGLLDGAEAAALLLAVADAGLDDGGREDVLAVQPGDLLVAHPVGGGEVVEEWALHRNDIHPGVRPVEQHPAIHHRERAVGVAPQRRPRTVDGDVPVVAGTGAGSATHGQGAVHPQHGQIHAGATDVGARDGAARGHRVRPCRWS